MAWNIDQVIEEGVSGHLCNFLKREFGEAIGEDLLPVMMEHYRLSYIRKPEFMEIPVKKNTIRMHTGL